jgi:ABC-type uncharacterized transport system auxiliary subunit
VAAPVPLRGAPPRRLRLLAVLAALATLLAGCASSPEAARVRGEPGADPGNHSTQDNPSVLVGPQDRFERIYAGIPYDGPHVAVPDTAQS